MLLDYITGKNICKLMRLLHPCIRLICALQRPKISSKPAMGAYIIKRLKWTLYYALTDWPYWP